MRISVATETGYKAEIDVVQVRDVVQVKSAAYLLRGILSPFIVLREFRGDKARERAEKYANGLADALIGEEEK